MQNSDYQVIWAPHCLPLKKGDIVIERCTYHTIKWEFNEYYTLDYVIKGGQKPRGHNNSPIRLENVVGVIRKGWPLPDWSGSANTPEEAVKLALKHKQDKAS